MHRRTLDAALLTAPALLVFLACFLVPLAYFFVVSFWRVVAYKLTPDLTLESYAAVFGEYGQPLAYTLVVALCIAVVVTSLAFVFAYYCRFKAGRRANLLMFVVLLTLFGGYLTKIYAWKTMLGAQGVVNSALQALGLTHEPLSALLFNPAAVVVALTHYAMPFAVLPIYGAMRGVKDASIEAARDLGAGRMAVVRDVVLPQCRMGVVAAFALAFLLAAGDYVAPVLVGGPNTSMMGTFVQSQFGHRLNAPLGSAMSFVVVGACLSIIAAFNILLVLVTRPR